MAAVVPPIVEAQPKTVVIGLKGQLLNPSRADLIAATVKELSEIRFNAYSVLHIYATLVAAAGTATGEVFGQTIVDQALAFCRYAVPKPNNKAPPLLRQAADLYFDPGGPLANNRTTRAESMLTAGILQECRTTMVVAFQNCLELSTPSQQRMAIQELYDLSAKEAKLVCVYYL